MILSIPHQLPTNLSAITSPWPFMKWALDMVGPLRTTPSHKKFFLAAINYFTNLVEMEAYANDKDG